MATLTVMSASMLCDVCNQEIATWKNFDKDEHIIKEIVIFFFVRKVNVKDKNGIDSLSIFRDEDHIPAMSQHALSRRKNHENNELISIVHLRVILNVSSVRKFQLPSYVK